MKLVLLAFGSRGDVQPMVALGRGLQSAGYDLTIAAGEDFRGFVESASLAYAPFHSNMQNLVNSDAGREWLGGNGNPYQEIHAMKNVINSNADQMTQDTLNVTADADVIISGLPLFATAQTLAEKMGKQHITTQFMPVNPTKCHDATARFALPGNNWINKLSGYISQYALYWVTKDALNKFRRKLGMEPMSYWDFVRAYNQEVPILYGASKHVISEPDDWNDNTHITGYWFYDAPPDWQPSPELCAFLANGDKPVYIGFGSMSSKSPETTLDIMVEALQKTDQRGIIYSGWAGLHADDLPDDIFLLDGAPHDWLFPQMAAVVHHGGAGTTAAGFRAGVPSTIVWHMGDQPYWGRRAYELGVGAKPIPRHNLSVENLKQAINTMTTSHPMQTQARILREKICQDNGIERAVEIIGRLTGQ